MVALDRRLEAAMNQLTTLLVGFVLTSVLGGALGVLFQRRTWEHQHQVQAADLKRQQASQVFDEISRLLDRRLYRLRLLNWRLQAKAEGKPHTDLDSKMQDYRDALREWNENVNRNLALLQRYFGVGMRDQFDNEIGMCLVHLGYLVEIEWRRAHEVAEPSSRPALTITYEDLSVEIEAAADAVYEFNLRMLDRIDGQDQHVGSITTPTRERPRSVRSEKRQ
jgi:Tfp pilus assembly protein PilN